MRKIVAFLALMLMTFPALAQVLVSGGVYEQDSISPIEGVEITFSGYGFEGDTLVFQFFTDSIGHYEGDLEAGNYWVCVAAEGYQTEYLPDSLVVEEGQTLSVFDFVLFEVWHPVRYVAARNYVSDLVRISWSMHDPLLYEDFETGDFSRFSWNNNLSEHPWAIDSIHAYEGQYCMKSTCEGVESGVSEIEVSVYVPLAGQMAFFSKISSESPWDVGRFYLDGVKKMECAGEEDWAEHYFDITAGEHLFRWTYAKDASTNVGDDGFYVDAIRFYLEDSLLLKSDTRSFQYYDLFRRRFEENPVLLASHLTDTVFMETNWAALPWGKYQWGVACIYEGNRFVSDTVWSEYLDKNMTTTLEINALTNVGLIPSGASVLLLSHEGSGHTYQATLDANGHLLLGNVYRDTYDLRVHLDGFVDYVSDEPISVWEPAMVEIELMEALHPIDSLYVSSTGWVIWQFGEAQNRDLQYVELMIDSVPMGISLTSGYQFDVSGLTAGETYWVQARPVYLSDTCDWHSYTWTYRSCADFQGSGNGLNWAVQNEAVRLSWTYPEGDSLLGAMLYRDGAYLAFTEENTFLDLTVEMHDDVEYCLRLVYDGATDGTYYAMSCEECTVATFPAYCDPPVKLDAENFLDDNGDYGALVSWGERPTPINHWLHYDDNTFKESLGSDALIFWSVRFDAEDLAEFVGTSLKKIAIFDVRAGTYQLWVYVGGDNAPHTPVCSQNMTLTGSNAWHEETIAPALEIPENEPIWIVVGQQGLNRPAAACADMGNPNGRWVSLDGVEWFDMHHFNMYYTWMLRAFVTNRAGRMMPLDEGGFVLQHYNLYRSYDNVDYQQIATIPFVEGQEYYQYRDVLFGDEHSLFYYRLTADYLSDEGETCESDFAASLNHPENQYVWVDDHWNISENQEDALMVYPNPAKDVLNIEVKDLCHLSVFNALGQCVASQELAKDEAQLDVSGLRGGLYLLKVETKNAVASRRFVVAH
jgi:hypothetical protein